MADQPVILAFCCHYCAYAAADLAGSMRLQYPSNVRVLRLPCTGKIEVNYLLSAFERGADGVIVSGCHPGDCHYAEGNYHARRRFRLFKELMDFTGIDSQRVTFSWVSASQGQKWADVVNETTERIRALGVFDDYPGGERGEVA